MPTLDLTEDELSDLAVALDYAIDDLVEQGWRDPDAKAVTGAVVIRYDALSYKLWTELRKEQLRHQTSEGR